MKEVNQPFGIFAMDYRHVGELKKEMRVDYDMAAPAKIFTGEKHVVVISVSGVINFAYTQYLKAHIANAVSEESVSEIVLDIQSPGGSVFGVQELADFIYQSRSAKKITAFANPYAASAAFFIGAAASRFIALPSAEVGSIGVFAMHLDMSGMLEQDGVKVTFVYAGENKIEGNAYQPLSESAKSNMQEQVESYYQIFTGAVASYRNVSQKTVLDSYGKGRMIGAENAVKIGMIDAVALTPFEFKQPNARNIRLKQATNRLKLLEIE